jgi:hypothetical protein
MASARLIASRLATDQLGSEPHCHHGTPAEARKRSPVLNRAPSSCRHSVRRYCCAAGAQRTPCVLIRASISIGPTRTNLAPRDWLIRLGRRRAKSMAWTRRARLGRPIKGVPSPQRLFRLAIDQLAASRLKRSRKPLWAQVHRGFESLPLRLESAIPWYKRDRAWPRPRQGRKSPLRPTNSSPVIKPRL